MSESEAFKSFENHITQLLRKIFDRARDYRNERASAIQLGDFGILDLRYFASLAPDQQIEALCMITVHEFWHYTRPEETRNEKYHQDWSKPDSPEFEKAVKSIQAAFFPKK